MKILSRIFKPKEVRDTIFALNSLSQCFEQCWGFREVSAAVRRLLVKHPDRTRRSLILDGRAPLELALMLIRNRCIEELRSGRNYIHSYRGRLTMHGSNFRPIYEAATREMVERGYMTVDQAEEEQKGLLEIIAYMKK
jgi:hypothetical protein